MRSIELFSGAGGLAKGLEISGFKHIAFIESNRDACASLRLNFGSSFVFEGDIRDYVFPQLSDIDLIAGGPPCQPFSLGGKHGAFDDARDMFPYAIGAIERLKPKAFIIENVKGLLRPSFIDYFNYILARLRYPEVLPRDTTDWRDHLNRLQAIHPRTFGGVKYDVHYKLVNAADYGVPQTRERVVIIGIRSDLDLKWVFPQATHSEDRLIWDKFISGEYWERHRMTGELTTALSSNMVNRIERVRKNYSLLPPHNHAWQTVRDALVDVPNPQSIHTIPDHIFKGGARSYHGHTGSDFDWPSKTLKAGAHGVPGGENMIKFEDGTMRYLTIYEAKILQTFPRDFVITGAWGEAMRQIGNAVPVKLAHVMGDSLIALLNQIKNESAVAA